MNTKVRVLYLEDDADLGEVTSEILGREGFLVKWVNNGEKGLESIKDQSFDIVIADIMMPKLDGYTFLKRIREQGNNIPVILLSARVLTEDVLKGFSIGADDYIRKPFSIDELIARMTRLLKNITVSAAPIKTIKIGDYEYNPYTLKLKYKEQSLSLSPKAGEILHRLATGENGILLRDKTLIDLWGDDNFFNGRSLDVFISKLRKLLSKDPRINILNIRAVGYRLIIVV
ncbi:response regulator transcription factor [Chryseobacterium sp. Chry.R1]|uniref:response regulator transcription factor n=1 Tax=Chryseobacterium sp. Chry.R1 TaxID=3139392 RepID=UPI0031F95BCE